VWTTPSQAREPALAPVFSRLRGLTGRGVEVGFVEGNRDFAASPELRAAGVATLPDVIVIADGALRVVVTHGDRLCRRDVRYQAFRRFARSSTMRHLLRSVPDRVAHGAAGAARAGSKMETARKAYGDMGLDPVAVADLLRAEDADALVCGHVHWGKRYALDVDGRTRDVIVLGAWDAGDASFARIGGGRLEFARFTS
jgi:UDP-2,3-diacylglucosamine hydrolase